MAGGISPYSSNPQANGNIKNKSGTDKTQQTINFSEEKGLNCLSACAIRFRL
jgi:hypothetical protein